MGFFSKALALIGLGAAMQQSASKVYTLSAKDNCSPSDTYAPSYGGCGTFNYAEIQRAHRRNYRGKAMRQRSGNHRLARKFSRVKV